MTGAQKAVAGSLAGLVGTVLLGAKWRGEPPPPPPNVAIDVYEAVLQRWFDQGDSNALVNEHLASAPVPSDKEIADCLEGVSFRGGGSPVLDSLRGAMFKRKGVQIVDGEKWRPDDASLKAGVARGDFQDADLGRAFAHALISFSHIRFDQDGRLALLTFSHVCSDLCGAGFTLLMQKSETGWTALKQCREWVA